MTLEQRISDLHKLGQYMSSPEFAPYKASAFANNPWFEPEFIDVSVNAIVTNFLDKEILASTAHKYNLQQVGSKKVGIVCAGNIPLVGFHDMLCVLLCGHHAMLKLSSKDEVLMNACINFLQQQNTYWQQQCTVHEQLKNCDAYIATGSNNTARYFEQYFGKYKNIIRKNRSSVAILTGSESEKELQALASDIMLYFGMGCRNVGKLYVPQGYNFEKLLNSFDAYQHFSNHTKLKNNYDYNLALYLLNAKEYMSNSVQLFVENEGIFAPLSVTHYQYYLSIEEVIRQLSGSEEVQCIVGQNYVPFGEAQNPKMCDFADGVDTIKFIQSL